MADIPPQPEFAVMKPGDAINDFEVMKLGDQLMLVLNKVGMLVGMLVGILVAGAWGQGHYGGVLCDAYSGSH